MKHIEHGSITEVTVVCVSVALQYRSISLRLMLYIGSFICWQGGEPAQYQLLKELMICSVSVIG